MRARITILAPLKKRRRFHGGFNLDALANEALPGLAKIAHTGFKYLFNRNGGGRKGRGGGRTHGGRCFCRRK